MSIGSLIAISKDYGNSFYPQSMTVFSHNLNNTECYQYFLLIILLKKIISGTSSFDINNVNEYFKTMCKHMLRAVITMK